ncbi:hypothetical protein OIU77_018074 [Salix suchowensis]|uniref:Uncharacterized protein n=1 Tax=Salix suchowensis TaxID=1278906 RepID=A0ABQ8ZQZ4_9ROSI|nr:hypothetical protein OIU77_018074 [Salix suchowensis]
MMCSLQNSINCENGLANTFRRGTVPADGDSFKNELTIAISIATDSSTSKISSSEVSQFDYLGAFCDGFDGCFS